MLKNPVILSLATTLFLSLVMFDPPCTFGDKIDYKKIFKNDCQKCHGRDGKGSKRGKKLGAPDFTDTEWQASVTDKQLIASVTDGKKKMPSQKGKLSPEEIKALVKYVRMLATKKRR